MKPARHMLAVLLSLILIFAASGCVYHGSRTMAYTPTQVAKPMSGTPGGVLAVRSLRDDRGPRRYPSMTAAGFLMYIPLLPFIKVSYERLDESDEMTRETRNQPVVEEDRFPHQMMEVIAADLAKSGLFESVVFIGEDPVPADVDMVLSGDLTSTEFDVYGTSYMLGMPGVLLWILGIPNGSSAATVTADLALESASGESLWTGHLEGEGSKIFTAYTPSGAISSIFSLEIPRYGRNSEGIDEESLWAYHASAIRSGMRDVKRSLGTYLAERTANR